jgi:hypothetical protein
VELHFYRCRTLSEPAPQLGQEMAWVHGRDLASLGFPEADAELVRMLTSAAR